MKFELLKWIGAAVSLFGVIVSIIKISNNNAARFSQHEERIKNMEVELKKFKVEQEKGMNRLENYLIAVDQKNSNAHEKLFNKLGEVSEGLAGLHGYLKAKE